MTVHVPTASVALHVPTGDPSAVYPDGTVSVAVHVVPAALEYPVTVTVAGDVSVIVVGLPVTVTPDPHDTLTGTLDVLSSEKSLCTTNEAMVGVLVIVQVPAASVALQAPAGVPSAV
ncbi:MAG TPA: hypothetical protein VIH82_15030 [Acidimicrobiia bacterium]